ncbi:MAG TPA: efflux RND transporter periplasmic adaptor subunit [Gemmataceae bacterium]|nr:efflux RND transporter periplasmic adaptor subunit [Gemmataceae bacterium]
MPTQLKKLFWMLLDQLPTLFALAVLGAVAWWGFVLLYPAPSSPKEEAGQKPGEPNETPDAKKPLPSIKLASEKGLKPAGIKTGEVEERLDPEYVESHGDIDFNQDHYAHLSTRAAGTAFSVHKRAGDQVKKGDVLALIAAPELASLKFDLQQTLLTEQTRKKYYDRLKSSGKSTSQQALDNAEASLREARIRLSKDQQSLQNLGLTVSIDELRRLSDEQVADRLRTLGIPDSLLQRLDNSTLTSNLLPMYTPFDGMVVKRDIVIGEVVNPAKPQFVLADLSQLWIMLHVRLEDANKLKPDQEVSFHLDGPNEDAPPAKIDWISAAVDEETRTVPVRADVANPKGRLRPGTFGDAKILVRQEKHLLVPTAALQFDGISYVVFGCGESDTEFQPLRVDLGPQSMRTYLIPFLEEFTVVFPHVVATQKIAAGQRIAISGTQVLLSEMQKERIAGED